MNLPSDHLFENRGNSNDDEARNNNNNKVFLRFHQNFHKAIEVDKSRTREQIIEAWKNPANKPLVDRQYELTLHYALSYELRIKKKELSDKVDSVLENGLLVASVIMGRLDESNLPQQRAIKSLLDKIGELEIVLTDRTKELGEKKEGGKEKDGDDSPCFEELEKSKAILSDLSVQFTTKRFRDMVENYDSAIASATERDEKGNCFYAALLAINNNNNSGQKDAQEETSERTRVLESIIAALDELLKDHARQTTQLLERWLFCILYENQEARMDALIQMADFYLEQERSRSSTSAAATTLETWFWSLDTHESWCKEKMLIKLASLNAHNDSFGTHFVNALLDRHEKSIKSSIEDKTKENDDFMSEYPRYLGLSDELEDGVFCLKEEAHTSDKIPEGCVLKDFSKILELGNKHDPFHKVELMMEEFGDELIYIQHPFLFNVTMMYWLGLVMNDPTYKELYDRYGDHEIKYSNLVESKYDGKAKRQFLMACYRDCTDISLQAGYSIAIRYNQEARSGRSP